MWEIFMNFHVRNNSVDDNKEIAFLMSTRFETSGVENITLSYCSPILLIVISLVFTDNDLVLGEIR